MSTILACIDASAAARPVLQTAVALGQTLKLPVAALHVPTDDTEPPRQFADAAGVQLRVATGAPIDMIAAALAADEVALGVLGVRGLPGGRRPAGHTALALARQVTKPLVVVPPVPGDPPPAGLHRVLVPLDGTPTAAQAVQQATERFTGSGVEILALHVFDATTVPRFWDRPQYNHQAWSQEFLARWCPTPGARLALRAGRPGGQVLAVAAAQQADMIALGWSQDLAPDRAAVVREVLARTDVPVLLLPCTAAANPVTAR
jgi:nucleotide-binding universal stress UspA family protein